MPNRLIKSSIHESEKVNQMTDFQFRVWVNLITYVDDYGRGDARPAIIKGNCFPLRDRLTAKDIETALKALADIGCVVLYEVDGKPYLYFPNWESHQIVRNKKSKCPEPPPVVSNPQEIASNCIQLHSNVSVIQSNTNTNTNTNPNTNTNAHTRFTPPTVEEVKEYCLERKNGIDPQYFVDYYTQTHWRRKGGEKIVDWKATIRTWERNNFSSGKVDQKKQDYMHREYSDADFAAMEVNLDAL